MSESLRPEESLPRYEATRDSSNRGPKIAAAVALLMAAGLSGVGLAMRNSPGASGEILVHQSAASAPIVEAENAQAAAPQPGATEPPRAARPGEGTATEAQRAREGVDPNTLPRMDEGAADEKAGGRDAVAGATATNTTAPSGARDNVNTPAAAIPAGNAGNGVAAGNAAGPANAMPRTNPAATVETTGSAGGAEIAAAPSPIALSNGAAPHAAVAQGASATAGAAAATQGAPGPNPFLPGAIVPGATQPARAPGAVARTEVGRPTSNGGGVATPPASPPVQPPAAPAAARSKTDFNTQAAREALEDASLRAGKCKTIDTPSGTARIAVTFAPNGQATNAVVESGSIVGTAAATCVAAKFRAARVPPFSGEAVLVRKSVPF
jgi:hypothetical protein